MTRLLPLFITVLLLAPFSAQAQMAPPDDRRLQLPDLGGPSSSLFSPDQAHQLGRLWLKAFRGRVQTVSDPLMQEYLENLLGRLAPHSDLADRRLEMVVVDNRNLNAFAVPGGVIGVHNGLFLHADNESQLAGVLSHELAHLSQQHFQRQLARQRESSLPALAGLLAGIVLAATGSGDAGMAAIAAGQAATMETQLRYSRQHEIEADRIAMRTLVEADMDPRGIPGMFENMHQQFRHAQTRPPEFLLTHPLTESRIVDSRNRARQYPRNVYTDNPNFQLMKRRAAVQLTQNPRDLLEQWQSTREGEHSEANRYGAALALMRLDRWEEAAEQMRPLLEGSPQRIAYVVGSAEILVGKREYGEAAELLREHLALSPGNHPLTMKLADVLRRKGHATEAEELLVKHSRQRPEDPDVWYQLSEIHGLAGNVLGVHTARAEYYILNGMLDRAEQHLRYARPMAQDDNVTRRRIEQRLRDIQELREAFKRFS